MNRLYRPLASAAKSRWVQSLALALAYAGSALAGLNWSIGPGVGTPVWPAGGIAMAVLLLAGPRLWPGLIAGRLLTSMLVGWPQPFWPSVLIAVGAAASAVGPVWALRRLGFDHTLRTVRSAFLLIGAAVAASAITAVFLLVATAASGEPLQRAAMLVLNGFVGHGVGILVLAPLILSWVGQPWPRWPVGTWLLFLLAIGAMTVAAGVVMFDLTPFNLRVWHLFPFAVAAAVGFTMRGSSLAVLATGLFALVSTMRGVGPLSLSPDATVRILTGQQFIALVAGTMMILAAASDERRGRERLERSEKALRAETEALETLNACCQLIASELQMDRLVDQVIDAGRRLTGAKFGAFFYTAYDEAGGSMKLFALSGAPREAFERFGHPRATKIFAPTFEGSGVVRLGDVTADPRYGSNAPHRGMPDGHLPVRSYLAVPVRSRSGEAIGGLFFGHPEAGVFTERSEKFAVGIASQAAIALDNARLLQDARREIEQRKQVERRQQLLIHELNHRVKNTLVTVQSLARQTVRPGAGKEAQAAFEDRLLALSSAHDVLTSQEWQGADIRDIVAGAIRPFGSGAQQFQITGPGVSLHSRAALSLAMALHELGTNALKYGALQAAAGRVDIAWRLDPSAGGDWLCLEWRESGGPAVTPPERRGFGSRLVEWAPATELDGQSELSFAPEGVRYRLRFPLAPAETPLDVAQAGGPRAPAPLSAV